VLLHVSLDYANFGVGEAAELEIGSFSLGELQLARAKRADANVVRFYSFLRGLQAPRAHAPISRMFHLRGCGRVLHQGYAGVGRERQVANE